MGHAYEYRCEHCGYTEAFNQGHGFLVHSQLLSTYLEQPQKAFHYKTQQVLVRLARQNNGLFLKAGFQVYKCPKCKTLHDKTEVVVYNGDKVLHRSEFRCAKCRSRLKLTNIHRLKNAICPQCHQRTFRRARISPELWSSENAKG